METTRFEDLFIWKEAILLAKTVFPLFENCRNFSLRNQVERASISISANIAEGHELQTQKQLIKHLYIAKASCGELRSLLTLAKELNIISVEKLDPIIANSTRLSVLIYKFIRNRPDK
jgi:four helix bundle protein